MRERSGVLELLERSRALGQGDGCLADATLEALADGSLGATETTAAGAHLRECLGCLHAYAAVRALLEPPPRPQTHCVRRLVATRVRLPWAAAAMAAAVVLTWLLATTAGREPAAPDAPRVIEMAGRQGPQTVAGAVQTVEDAGAPAVAAHVLGLAGDDGRRYTIFVWGGPTVRVGDRVSVEGHFEQTEESAAASARHGVAIRLRPVASH